MSNITKKQTSLALFAVVFATAMIVGTFATVADNSAFARHSSSITQNSFTSQSANCISPGGSGSTTGGAGGAIAAGACVNSATTNNQINTGSNTH